MANEQPVIPEPPQPKGAGEFARVRHTRLRRRLLYGLWEPDLIDRLQRQLGHVRRKAWGVPDLSANPFRVLCQQLAVLYDRAPTIGHADAAAAAELTQAVHDAGLWALMPRVQRDLIGMRENYVRIDVRGKGENARLLYRPVPPDLIEGWAAADDPDVPVHVAEAVLRRTAQGHQWTWEVFDITNPDEPYWQILDANGDDATAKWGVLEDGSAAPAGGLRGDAYEWRGEDGRPFIPGTLYHAARTGSMWDAWEGSEAVEGTLNVAVLWTFFAHCVRNASWPQRYILGAKFAGTSAEGEDESDARVGVVSDPAAIAELVADENSSTQPTAGQWSPSTSPAELEEAVSAYERRLATFAGLSPADLQRTSGDPRSGYALAVSREGQREAQRRFLPNAQRGDLELLTKSAALLNRARGTKLPEDGWSLTYESIPMSQDERTNLLELANANLLDKIDAYTMLNPGTGRDQAERRLDEIARLNARFRS